MAAPIRILVVLDSGADRDAVEAVIPAASGVELLNVTEGTVRMRISRGRAAFRAAYGAGEDDDAP